MKTLWPIECSESPSSIQAWAKSTFGDESLRSLAAKLFEESSELLWELDHQDLGSATEELADVLIVLARLPGRFPALGRTIDRKMQRNRERKWARQPDGTMHHEGGES